jgi:hypothetical protein
MMNERSSELLDRLAPVAGVAYAGLTIAGDLTIGKLPDSGTSVPGLASFYAAHHLRVAAGGMLLAWAAIMLAAFGCALWAHARHAGTHATVCAAILVGTAAAVAAGLQSASIYWILGHLSGEAGVTPAALQAWHIAGSEGALAGGVAVLLLATAAAGLLSHTVPVWLAWPALVLGLLQLTPVGFLASMLFLLWAAVTGILLAARPSSGRRAAPRGDPRHARSVAALPER